MPTCCVCNFEATKSCDEQYGWDIWKCIHCGFYFSEAGPTARQPRYDQEYFSTLIHRDDDEEWRNFYTTTLESIKEHSPGPRILDAGSGASMFAPTAKRSGWQVTVIDGSRDAIDYLRNQFGIDGYVADLNALDSLTMGLGPQTRFDAVNSWHVIEHLSRPDLYLAGIRDVLVENGCLHLGLPVYPRSRLRVHETLRWLGLAKHHFNLGMPDHVSFFERKTIVALLERCGFRVHRVEKTAYTSLYDISKAWSSHGIVRRVAKAGVCALQPISSWIRWHHHLRIFAFKA